MKTRKTGRTFLAAVLAAVTILGATPMHATAVMAGDINGDGKINLADASLMLKSVAKWGNTEINSDVADVTEDGKVNLADVSRLLKHIAGWGDLAPLPDIGYILDLEGVKPIKHSDLGYDDYYTNNCKGEYFLSYYEEPFESFLGVCKYHEDDGYELHSYNVLNGNHFATYVKGKKLSHIYWIECESELNVAQSDNCGEAMPPKTPEVTTGEYKTSVTQLQSPEDNGMGYAVQLADGSFILYDGGYDHRADEMWDTLVTLNGGEENIVIRAWLITHSHSDHYQCFREFANKYADKVTLERLMISPINKEDMGGDTYLHEGAKESIEKEPEGIQADGKGEVIPLSKEEKTYVLEQTTESWLEMDRDAKDALVVLIGRWREECENVIIEDYDDMVKVIDHQMEQYSKNGVDESLFVTVCDIYDMDKSIYTIK